MFFIHNTRVLNEGFRLRPFVCVSHTILGYGMRAFGQGHLGVFLKQNYGMECGFSTKAMCVCFLFTRLGYRMRAFGRGHLYVFLTLD